MSPDDVLNGAPSNSNIPEVPKCLRIRSVTNGLISYAESLTYPQYKRAAHVFIWAPWEGHSFCGERKAAVLMQMRFDGTIGFAGGIVNKGEDLIEGLNRELEEEVAWDLQKHKVTMADYYNSQVNDGKKLVFHLFVKQISFEDFADLEARCLKSKDYGSEVMGSLRVPLYTMRNNYGGLPAFLNNKFAGGAKQQLLLALYHTQILAENEIEEVVYKSQNMKLAASRF